MEAGVNRKPLRWQHREHRAAGDTARDRDGGGWGEPPGGHVMLNAGSNDPESLR